MEDFRELLERGDFSVVPIKEALGVRVHDFRCFDSIKDDEKPRAFENSRLDAEAYNENDRDFLTHAPTVQRIS